MQPTSPPIEGPKTLVRCPKCSSEHVQHQISLGEEPTTTYACIACDEVWETKGGRLTPANADETMKCLADLDLYGMAFVDGKGIRVHPSMAIFDDDGLHDSNGRPLFKPTPVVFP